MRERETNTGRGAGKHEQRKNGKQKENRINHVLKIG